MCAGRWLFSLVIICAFISQRRSQKMAYGRLSQPRYTQNSHNYNLYGGYICYPTYSPGQLIYHGWQTPTLLSGIQYPPQQSNSALQLISQKESTKVPLKGLPPGQVVPQHGLSLPTAGSQPKELSPQGYAAPQQAFLLREFPPKGIQRQDLQPELMDGTKPVQGLAGGPQGPPRSGIPAPGLAQQNSNKPDLSKIPGGGAPSPFPFPDEYQ